MKLDSSGWVKNITLCPSPNFNARPKNTKVDLLVIHNISLPPHEFGGSNIQAFFQNKLDPSKHPFYETIKDLRVSAHFLIERTGSITQFVSVFDRAWHAGISSFNAQENCNDYSLGIELEGTDELAFTDQQYQALAELTSLLQQQFPALTAARIVGHHAIALPLGRKTDPGPYFDWPRYLQSLNSSPK